MEQYSRSVPTLVAVFFLLYFCAPVSWQMGREAFYRHRLSSEVEIFRTALDNARTDAMRRGEVLGVKVGRHGWAVYRDSGTQPFVLDPSDTLVSMTPWEPHVYAGSNTREFFFDTEGLCRTAPDHSCIPDGWNHTAPSASVISITSDAHLIYTVFFATDGAAMVARDDF
jgi:hypothetical protein